MIKEKKVPFEDRMEKYIALDHEEWHRCSEGDYPLPGNRRILIPWEGSVWLASRDPLKACWNIIGTAQRRLSADIELWMPLPDCPNEPQPFDAFTRKPASMYKEESA